MTDQKETCGYVELDYGKVHYRHQGSGPPMLLLHASPLSAKSLRPAMQVFGDHFGCFALDTPGYGQSDPLPERLDDIFAYADSLKQTIDAMGLDQPIVYGASTGAMVAHAFGCKYPDASQLLMLDTFSHHDAEKTLGGYFPDVTPKRTGAHLLQCWEKVESFFLFSPWQRDDADSRLKRDLPPPQVLHNMAMDLLTAGPDYRHVYAQAFEWADKDHVNKLTAPATLNIWQGSPGIQRVQMLVDLGLPDNYTTISAPPGPAGRYGAQLEYLLEHGFERARAVALPKDATDGGSDGRRYVSTSAGQVHLRQFGETPSADAKPLLLLHDLGGSSRQHRELATILAANRMVVLPDLPGHGDTPCDGESLGDIIAALVEVLNGFGIEKADVLGVGHGALIGGALKEAHPDLIDATSYLATRPILTGESGVEALSNRTARAKPQPGGAHMIDTMGVVKQESLFWHWPTPTADSAIVRDGTLNPQSLHRRTLDMLQCRADLGSLRTQLADDPCALHCFAPTGQVGEETLNVRLARDFDRVTELPEAKAEWAATITDAL